MPDGLGGCDCQEISPGPCPNDAHEVIGACSSLQGCCLPGGVCDDLDPLCCLDKGGKPQGDNTACTMAEACCLSGGACVEVDPLCCDELNGALPGEPVCLGDADGDGADDACVPAGEDCFPDCSKLNVECLNPSREYDNRRPVGRVLVDGVGWCTGWIIAAPDCIITNRHCITTDGSQFGPLVADITTRSIEFNFECEECFGGPCKTVDTYQVVELLHENASLDYALLKVAGNPAAIWGTLVVSSNPPIIGERIYEIHHAGTLKKGYDDGVVTAHNVPGTCIPGTAEEVDITAIASGGASGSPVFRQSNHCVMALCHCGPECEAGSAIPMSAVLPDALPHILAAECTPVDCPLPGVEACCLPDGTCIDKTVGDCAGMGGSPQGSGTTCATTTCPAREACCSSFFADGCANAFPAECVASPFFGTPQGAGTDCTPGAPGGSTAEACCLPGGSCVDIEPLCCDDSGGFPSGAPACLTDQNGNGIDDACEIEPPVRASAPHDILKNRYISIDPRGASGNNPSSHHIRVTLVSSLVNGQAGNGPWWANAPFTARGHAPCISLVTTTKPAVEPDWSGCGTVHLTGCPIIPTTTYAIAAESGGVLSADSLLDTQAKPGVKWHGDCVGFFDGAVWTPPNGTTSIDDAVAAIKTFQDPSKTPGCGAPPCNATHVSVTDVVPNLNGTQINLVVNINDVFSIILGFQGQEYPGSDLTQCP